MHFLLKSKKFLNKLFWLDKFEGKNKFLLFGAKFFMYGYIVFIVMGFIEFVATFDLGFLVSLCFLTFVYPIMYRIIMGLQRFIHNI